VRNILGKQRDEYERCGAFKKRGNSDDAALRFALRYHHRLREKRGGERFGVDTVLARKKAPIKMRKTINALRIKGFRWSFQADSNC